MLIFQDHTLDRICSHAVHAYPLECCGVLLGRRTAGQRRVCQVVPTQNHAGPHQQRTQFSMDPLDFVRIEQQAEEAGWEVVGFYHSHPDCEAQPSREDMVHMLVGCSYPILSVDGGGCRSIRSFERVSPQSLSVKSETITTQEGLL